MYSKIIILSMQTINNLAILIKNALTTYVEMDLNAKSIWNLEKNST